MPAHRRIRSAKEDRRPTGVVQLLREGAIMYGIGIVDRSRGCAHEDEQSQAKDGNFHLHGTCRASIDNKIQLTVLRKSISSIIDIVLMVV